MLGFMHSSLDRAFGLTLALSLLLAACAPSEKSTDKASTFGRKVLGPGVPYEAIPADAAQLNTSIKDRRAHAWRVFYETVRPVPIDISGFLAQTPGSTVYEIPKWQTWYDLDEVKAIFKILYIRLDDARQQSFREQAEAFSLTDEEAEEAIRAHVNRRLPASWDDQRFLETLSVLKDNKAIAGVSGVAIRGVTLFSPAAVRHILKNAAFIARCAVTGPCLQTEFPEDATIVKATFTEQRTGTVAFATEATAAASLLDPARGVHAGSWIGEDQDFTVLKLDNETAMSSIYNVEYFNGTKVSKGIYHLTGLHIATKEVRNWVWSTFWWSDRPDSDFGQDRPALVKDRLSREWSNYKMCVITEFQEQDPGLLRYLKGETTSFDSPHSELYAAIKAFTENKANPDSWCSNPYIEHMPGGANGNCIGCHQFSGRSTMPTIGSVKGRMVDESSADFVAAIHGGLRGLSFGFKAIADDPSLRANSQGAPR